jgi:hypothetical protein
MKKSIQRVLELWDIIQSYYAEDDKPFPLSGLKQVFSEYYKVLSISLRITKSSQMTQTPSLGRTYMSLSILYLQVRVRLSSFCSTVA